MDYKRIIGDGYHLHIIKSKKFHTIDFRVCFTQNVDKQKLTYHNALVDIMTLKTQKYNTRQKLIKKCQELYSLSPVAYVNRYGNILTTCFDVSTPCSSYIDHNNLLENILLLKEIIFHPFIKGSSFNQEDVKIIKKNLSSETNTISEEPQLYANIELLKALSEKENYTLTGFSDLEILDKMDGSKLYKSYLDMLKNSRIDILVSGPINNTEDIIETIQKNFLFSISSFSLHDPMTYHETKKEKPNIIKETKKYQQSKMSIALKCYDLNNYENRYVFRLLNGLLGGSANSLLMRNVREKKSLCYYVGSYSNSLDNLLIINCGIDKQVYEKALSLILKTIDDLKIGKFTKGDLEKAKSEYLVNIDKLFDSNQNIIEYYYDMEIFKSDSLEKKRQQIKKVSKDDIIRVANKINVDTVFFLEGDL